MANYLSFVGDGKLSPNFTKKEFRDKSTGSVKHIDERIPVLAELVRRYSGNRSVTVNSAVRNYVPKGGVQNSEHMSASAVDLGLDYNQRQTLYQNRHQFMTEAVQAGLVGLGLYTWGVHIDVGQHSPAVYFWGDSISDYAIRHWEKGYTFGFTNHGKISDMYNPDNVIPVEYSTTDVEEQSDDEHRKSYLWLLLLLGMFTYYFTTKR